MCEFKNFRRSGLLTAVLGFQSFSWFISQNHFFNWKEKNHSILTSQSKENILLSWELSIIWDMWEREVLNNFSLWNLLKFLETRRMILFWGHLLAYICSPLRGQLQLLKTEYGRGVDILHLKDHVRMSFFSITTWKNFRNIPNKIILRVSEKFSNYCGKIHIRGSSYKIEIPV